MDGDRGRIFFFLELWSFRLYLGASSCIYFLAHDVFILMFFLWDVYVRGRHYVFISVSCFTCTSLCFYKVIHDICFLFSVL